MLTEKLTGERGIIFHREVQIRQPAGPQLGPRTDLHVDAVVHHRNILAETLTTIVEVKGCWNPDATTAFQTQLVDDYLLGTGNRFGIYLVAWFESDRWNAADGRRSACPRRDRDDTVNALRAQAVELGDQHDLYLKVVALTIPIP
jgi:hypothetical protein